MNENDAVQGHLDDAKALWRRLEARIVQYSGLATLANRKYKWLRIRIAYLNGLIADRARKIEKLIEVNDDLCRRIFRHKDRIEDLEEKVAVLKERYQRYFGTEKPTNIKDRINDILKRSNEVHEQLDQKVKGFNLPRVKRKIKLDNEVLVLNCNGTYYFEANNTKEFIEKTRSDFLELLRLEDPDSRQEIARRLLLGVHVAPDRIEEIVSSL